MKHIIIVVLLLAFIGIKHAIAQYAFFTRDTDCIRVLGTSSITNSGTIEARLMLNSGWNGSGNGMLYNAWVNFNEDQRIQMFTNTIWTYLYNTTEHHSPGLSPVVQVEIGVWHHVAFVIENVSSQRLYLDGLLVASNQATGGISTGGAYPMIGAIYRDGVVKSSFHGVLHSLRVSNTARYSGASITPPDAPFKNDASTMLLLNFNAANGTAIIYDASTNHYACNLGSGFSGATSPSLGPLPTLSIRQPTNDPVISWLTITNLSYQLRRSGPVLTNWGNVGYVVSNSFPEGSFVETSKFSNVQFYQLQWTAP